ncbi:unnamed protein product [Sphagnum balticum]
MYPGRRFVSGFGKTDGRTDGRTTGRSCGLTGRTGGRRTDARTRGGCAEESGGGPETDQASERKREKRERGREDREDREREALQRRRFPGASLTLPTSLIAISRERKQASDAEERGAPAQILSKEGSVAS